jgi:hypothetical protein
MSLTKCRECGKDVSTEAKSCPSCGAKPPKPTSVFTLIAGGIFIFFVGGMVVSSNEREKKPALTPEQAATKAKEEAAFQITVLAVKAVKKALRDPESITWESICANDDASIICIEYRARNGCGGLNKEVAIFTNGKVSQRAETWNKHCTKPLQNMIHARHAV